MIFPILSFIVATPALAALLLVFLPDEAKTAIRAISVAASAVALAGSIYVAQAVMALGPAQFHFHERYPIIPSLGINYIMAVDGWGASLMLLTGLIIFAGSVASTTLENRPREFYIFLLGLVAGVFGVFVAQDLFVFFLFYEIAVLPMYLLIGIWGSTGKVESKGPFAWAMNQLDVGGKEYAAMKLTLVLLGGSALILAAMLGMYFAGGHTFDMGELAKASIPPNLQWWLFPALWIGFGALAGLFPFHTWSPDGHAAAPTAVSMLHAGVLMKLGAFGVLRVGMVLLPYGARDWAFTVGTVAVINILWGAMSAMAQKDLKYIIAYSSVSHMGVVLLGAATLTVNGWNGAMFQMFAHGIMTGLFFALVGLIYDRTHDRWIPHMGGFANIMPFIAVFFTIGGLSSLGMPGTAGFVAEFLVFLGAWQGPHAWWAVPGAVGALITAVYVLRGIKDIFWGAGPPPQFAALPDARGAERVALVVLGTALIVFGVWPRLILDLIDAATPLYLSAIVATQAAGVTP